MYNVHPHWLNSMDLRLGSAPTKTQDTPVGLTGSVYCMFTCRWIIWLPHVSTSATIRLVKLNRDQTTFTYQVHLHLLSFVSTQNVWALSYHPAIMWACVLYSTALISLSLPLPPLVVYVCHPPAFSVSSICLSHSIHAAMLAHEHAPAWQYDWIPDKFYCFWLCIVQRRVLLECSEINTN